jgi:hypothetical protein
VQIAPETCRPNDERNKEYSVHLVGLELNIYVTNIFETTKSDLVRKILEANVEEGVNKEDLE